MLQVNSVIDVGVSAYSQLQKLKGQEIDATDSDKAKKNVSWRWWYCNKWIDKEVSRLICNVCVNSLSKGAQGYVHMSFNLLGI